MHQRARTPLPGSTRAGGSVVVSVFRSLLNLVRFHCNACTGTLHGIRHSVFRLVFWFRPRRFQLSGFRETLPLLLSAAAAAERYRCCCCRCYAAPPPLLRCAAAAAAAAASWFWSRRLRRFLFSVRAANQVPPRLLSHFSIVITRWSTKFSR